MNSMNSLKEDQKIFMETFEMQKLQSLENPELSLKDWTEMSKSGQVFKLIHYKTMK